MSTALLPTSSMLAAQQVCFCSKRKIPLHPIPFARHLPATSTLAFILSKSLKSGSSREIPVYSYQRWLEWQVGRAFSNWAALQLVGLLVLLQLLALGWAKPKKKKTKNKAYITSLVLELKPTQNTIIPKALLSTNKKCFRLNYTCFSINFQKH